MTITDYGLVLKVANNTGFTTGTENFCNIWDYVNSFRNFLKPTIIISLSISFSELQLQLICNKDTYQDIRTILINKYFIKLMKIFSKLIL